MAKIRRFHDDLVVEGVNAGTLAQLVLHLVQGPDKFSGCRLRLDVAFAVNERDANLIEPRERVLRDLDDRGQCLLEIGASADAPCRDGECMVNVLAVVHSMDPSVRRTQARREAVREDTRSVQPGRRPTLEPTAM